MLLSGPCCLILSAPLILLTLGLFILVVNGLLLWFVPTSCRAHVDDSGGAFWGAIVIGLVVLDAEAHFPRQRRARRMC